VSREAAGREDPKKRRSREMEKMRRTRRCRSLPFALAALLGLFGFSVAGEKAPQSVRLDSLESLYEAVEFDHAGHEEMVGNCATCHHHTAGSGVPADQCKTCHSVSKRVPATSCRECHPAQPFSAEYLRAKKEDVNLYHVAKLGLKGAYHRSCLGCHAQDGGPTGCQDCHPRSAKGDAFFRAGAGADSPKGSDRSAH
jgi:hypothetical protein